MGYVQTYSRLRLCSLNSEWRSRTCGYWYTVTQNGGTPHTAFRTKVALLRWLELTGLSVDGVIPEHGVHGSMPINGTYRQEHHLHDAADFYSIEGTQTRELSNGDYVDAIYSTDPYDGLRTVHTLNPNVKHRRIYDWRESQAMHDAGAL